MLDLAELLRIPRLDAGFDILPDGTRVAFAWNKTGAWQIYELQSPSPGGRRVRDEGEIKQITSSRGGKLKFCLRAAAKLHLSAGSTHIRS